MALSKTTCVKCDNVNPSNPYYVDPEDPDHLEKLNQHFKEVHGVDVDKFKRKDKSELHY